VVALLVELGVFWSSTMVDVEEERLKVFASGARCVSFSFLVSFQLIVESRRRAGGGGRRGGGPKCAVCNAAVPRMRAISMYILGRKARKGMG
jgi:hypothetical protein